MDSDEENRLLFYRQVSKARAGLGFDQMIENRKENEGFDQESSEELQKMREEPFSSSSQLREAKSKIKTNGASGSGSSVRVCDFCGKQFSSGKALGGHRRYHIQAQRKMEAQYLQQSQRENLDRDRHHRLQHPPNHYTLRIKPNNNNNSISEDFVADNEDNNNLVKSKIGNLNSYWRSPSFRCVVCDKDFPSKKSLFGHMRSHPEREWRGMNPPFTTADNALLTSSPSPERQQQKFKVAEDEQHHHHNNNNGSSSSTLEESSSVVVDLSSSCSGSSWLKKDRRGRCSIGAAEAAQNLMYLYLYGNSFIHRRRLPPSPPPPREEQLPPPSVLPVKKRKKKNVVNDNNNNVGSGSSSSRGGKKQRLDDDDDYGDYKEKLLEEAENEGKNNNIWDMKVMSLMKGKKLKKKITNKKRIIIKSEEAAEEEAEGELLLRTLKEQVMKSSSSPQRYVCKICNKSFPCFQALGGHRSKHNREKNLVINSTKGKEVLEQAAAEEEEEEKVCINGALLSSSAAGLSCEEEEKVCINGALSSNAVGMSCEEEEEEEEGASLVSTDEERLVSSSNNDNDKENNSNEEEASHESGGSKMLDFDLNMPYVSEQEEATDT